MSAALLRPLRLPALAAAVLLALTPAGARPAAGENAPLAALTAELRARLQEAPEHLLSPAAVARFYEARAFRPAWADGRGATAAARDLAAAVADAESHGLQSADYHAAALALPWEPGQGPAAGAEAELLRTDAFLTYAAHLAGGRVLPQDVEEDWEPLAREADPGAVLERALAGDCVAEALEALAPADPGYRALRRALARYRAIAAGGGWPGLAKPPVLHPGDRSPAAAVLRARLALEGYLESGEGPETMDKVLVGALRAFQAAHGLDADGVAGRATWGALQVPAAERAAQIQANLERWRWRRGEPAPRYLRVNVPAFRLEAVEGGETVLSLAVVVGRGEDPTPAFAGRVTHVVVNPSWSVPPEIAQNELLPEVVKDPGLLARRGFRLLRGWGEGSEELDPASVDWGSVTVAQGPLHFRQGPGPANALGRLKFLVPNRFRVYLHDTPARALFGKARRDFSHGCIRVERPEELAAYLFRNDRRWDPEALRAAIDAGEERTIPLSAPVPVHLEYFTAWADGDGPAHFRADIYGRDGRLDAALSAGPPST